MLTMFCVALRRDTYERVGPIDERFGLGLFEDDDYALRVRRAGYRIAYAEDVLIHHFGEASFGKLVPTGEHATLFKENQRRFEEKWGVVWQPHRRRAPDDYGSLVERIRAFVSATLPADASVLVVSKGDDELLSLDGRIAAHFPHLDGGAYAGHHPADSREVFTQLEALRANDATNLFLLFPKTSFWWLEHYAGLRDYLESRCETTAAEENTCVIYALAGGN
jgi:hypothetical protein